MDRRGGCCIARYDGNGVYDMSKMDRIMLKFRPIAPKPAVGGAVSGGSTPENSDVLIKNGRGKRRYVKDSTINNNGCGASKRGCGRKRKALSPEPLVVTLPLLPETPDRKDSPSGGYSSESTEVGGVLKKTVKNAPIWLSFGDTNMHVRSDGGHVTGGGGAGGGGYGAVVVSTSWVKVESMMNTCVDVYGLGCTDEERLMNLYKDTCPGFISDGLNRVRWVNRAYREMVGINAVGGGGAGSGEVIVSLVVKDGLRLPHTCAAFTCQVRVVTCDSAAKSKSKSNNTLTLPCDVWRMDSGEFAWRLDTKAALSLGR